MTPMHLRIFRCIFMYTYKPFNTRILIHERREKTTTTSTHHTLTTTQHKSLRASSQKSVSSPDTKIKKSKKLKKLE